VPSITGVRLKPFGVDAALLNISASGVLVECARGLRLGTAVTVVFDGTFPTPLVEGRVARSTVATMATNGSLRYHVGITFQTRIALELPAAAIAEPESAPADQAPAGGPALVNRW
jgi:PilZ domain-containing protein